MEIPTNGTRRIQSIAAALHAAYGSPRLGNPMDPVDDLVFICLSRMTQETKYSATYRALREALPTWDLVADAAPPTLEGLFRYAGLAKTKAQQIGSMLREIRHREGRIDLTRLHHVTDEEVERYLSSLPGVSRKTSLCVMMYTLDRLVLPVDTHVWRVSQRLGLASNEPWTERGGQKLEQSIPPDLRPSMHVNLIAHGRAVCRARRPQCCSCAISDLCNLQTYA